MSIGDSPAPDAVERHPYAYAWSERLEKTRCLRVGEGEATYSAVGEGACWIVHDSGTLADFLDDDEDAGLLATLITLERYDDCERWETAVQHLLREERRQRLRQSYSGQPYVGRRIDVLTHGGNGSQTLGLPLGEVWRARETEQLIVLQPGPPEPNGFVEYAEILDEFGLITLGAAQGSICHDSLEADYVLVSDPSAVAREIADGRESP